MASGHRFLCCGTNPTAVQLEELLMDLGNVGEAMRLTVKLLGTDRYHLVSGLVGHGI